MPDLMMIAVPDISAARAERVWAHVLETAAREQSRSKRRRAVGISAGATSLAGALGFALLAPTTSFASWTEVPRQIQVSQGDPSLTGCLTALSAGRRGQTSSLTRQPLLSEGRGDFTTFLLAGEGTLSICIADGADLWTASNSAPALPETQTLSVLGNAGLIDSSGPRFVYGRIADEVRGVTVVTEDGIRVTASVEDGYFLAWWPGSAAPATVTATDESGDVLASLIAGAGGLS